MTEKSDLKVLARALAFAAHKHRDQKRKDVNASPYINHPIALFDHLVNVGEITDMEILSNVMQGCGLEAPHHIKYITLDELLSHDNNLPTQSDRHNMIVQAHMVVTRIALRSYRGDEV